MPEQPSAVDLSRLPAAELNERISALSAGRTEWLPAELEELTRLRAAWLRAVARETGLAA